MKRCFSLQQNAQLVYFPSSYLDNGSPITEENRAVIVDWLAKIHQRNDSDSPSSLHLAVNIFDRYVASNESNIVEENLQLVGATSMLIASKFEDIVPITSKLLVRAARKKFTKDDLLDQECEVLSALRFKIVVPTGIPFLKRFLHLTKATTMMEEAAAYYLDRLLLEHSSLQEPPSLLAVACVCLAINHPQIHVLDEVENDPPGIVSFEPQQQHLSFSLKDFCPASSNLRIYRVFIGENTSGCYICSGDRCQSAVGSQCSSFLSSRAECCRSPAYNFTYD